MIFSFHDEAGADELILKGENYKYLIKVRRHQLGDMIALRQRENSEILYRYQLKSIDGRKALLGLNSSELYPVKAEKELHIGWCVIDPKSIEKVLPQLNEAGVHQITFITCKRSQKNFKLDFERFERILETSSQQCGRSQKMLFQSSDSVSDFLIENPQSAIFDFGGSAMKSSEHIDTVLVGCEGGFSEQERQLFDTNFLFSFKSPMVLRSESAVVAISVIILI